MKIEKLRLKGFTGIQKGLGLDEIEIDFNGISGLIAFEGNNGAGKSTVLENLGPYNQLASRDGALHRHVFLRDSEKELCFTYQSHSYRTLLKIDSGSEKSEGYIWVDGKPAVNGKISAYAKYMKELFGSPDLFYSSVFCSQNAKKLSDMRTGELKELFSEFLRLDRLAEYENTAKQCANIVNSKVANIDARVSGLREKLAGIDQIREGSKASGDHLVTLLADLDCKKGELLSCRTEIDRLKERITQNTLALQRKADIAANIERMQKELGKEKTDAESEIEALKDKYRDIQIEITKYDSILRYRDEINNATERERELSKYLELMIPEAETVKVAIAEHIDKINAIDREILTIDQSIRDLANDPEWAELDKEIRDIRTNISAKEQQINDIDNDKQVADLHNTINNCREKIATLDLKDPACNSTTCSFIISAIEASKELSALEAALQQRLELLSAGKINMLADIKMLKTSIEHREDERQKRIAYIEKEKTRLSAEKETKEQALTTEKTVRLSKEDLLIEIRQKINQTSADITKVKELAAKQTELQLADLRKVDLEKALQDITVQGKTLKDVLTAKETARKADIGELIAKLSLIDAEIDREAETKLAGLLLDVQNIENADLPGIEKAILETRERIAAIQSDLSKMNEAEKELDEIQSQKDALTRDASEWTYLKAACSKNGLQALEIDGAAPLITGYANDLLSMAFGPLYSIKLLTQDEEGRECLDIVVIGEDGEEILLENLSGGQKVWCLMALRLAMTLLSKEKSGRAFESFFSDESDGPLDPDNAINFINMYQSFMKLGGFTNGYFISHRPSCRAMAENILKFEYGKNPYWG